MKQLLSNALPRLLLSVAIGLTALPAHAQMGAQMGEWRYYAGDAGSTRYSTLDQINEDNVGELEVAWTWKADNFGSRRETRTETTPIMANGTLYFTAGDRRVVVAADPGTGETLWIWRMDEGERYVRAPRRNSGRGVSYWADGEDERILVITPGFQLAALDAKTGIPIEGFGENGIVDLFDQLDADSGLDPIGRIGNSSPPVIARDVVVVGPALEVGARVDRSNVKGDVLGFDVRTGERRWVFHTVPRPGEPGAETWLAGSAAYTGNAGVWAPFSADLELGYVYLPVEAPTNDVYGGHRPGDNLYSDSLVCLDVETGEVVWYQQLVHHDIWDFDMPSHPILIDINVQGRDIKAVVQLSKQAFAYVFDRATGEPVWPIEERPVPQSDVPGEQTSPTQPFPTKPPPFDLQGISRDDLVDFTPEIRERALEAVEALRIGPLFTPPSLVDAPDGTRGLLALPNFTGGANWESGAADPETGFVYVGSQRNPSIMSLAKPDPEEFDSDYISGGGSLPNVDGLPILKPPYGNITAYNMNEGEIAWQIANGITPPRIAENELLAGLDVPRTGSPSRAGLLATKSLLFAGEGSGGQPWFRAHNKLTGEIIWETEIQASTQSGVPMTYMHNDKQYVVFGAGGVAPGEGAQLIAYALPDEEE